MSVTGRLGGHRGLQVGVLTASLLVVLAFLAYDTVGRSQATRQVFVMTRSVVAGAALDSSTWREQQVPVTNDPYSYLAAAPRGLFAVHSLSPGDILRQDDVESTPRVAVPVKLGGYAPSAGELVDIYAIDSGKAILVGRGVPVLGAGTIEVPATDEPLWIALYGSSATLLAARSNGTGIPDAATVTAAEAMKRLSTIAQGGNSASPAP